MEVCYAHCNQRLALVKHANTLEQRAQSNSNFLLFLWFTYPAGRATASKMKAACHTDPSNPSQNLIKSIVNTNSAPKLQLRVVNIKRKPIMSTLIK